MIALKFTTKVKNKFNTGAKSRFERKRYYFSLKLLMDALDLIPQGTLFQ